MVQNKEITKVQELTYELKVEDVMSSDVTTVSPKNTMNELREILRIKRISGTPVVEGNQLVGIVSIEDLIKCLADGEMDASVEEKMTKKVETLYADESLVRAVSKFDRYGLGRLPVIERGQGKLVGILTKGDIIEGLLKKLEIDYHEEEIYRYRASHIFEDIVADKTSLYFQYNVVGQDFNRAGESASGLRKTLWRLGFRPQIVRRVAIATYEAEMNIVIFTNGGQISARVQPELIKIEASDTGPGIPDIERAMQPGFSTAPEWVQELGFGAGMGLSNIKKCADKMILTSQVGRGTDLKATIYIKGRGN
ncbi:MAG: CBS domain-containing protein [Dehalococcoidia bacterium]|nr:MAG: CBS domain-containing protein [Dehalococcoidia bacterium]